MATETPICDFGQPAIDFSLPGVDGNTWTLADCRGPNGLLAWARVLFISSPADRRPWRRQ